MRNYIIDVRESRATVTDRKGYLFKGELRWKCAICGKRNVKRGGIIMHLRRKHNIEVAV